MPGGICCVDLLQLEANLPKLAEVHALFLQCLDDPCGGLIHGLSLSSLYVSTDVSLVVFLVAPDIMIILQSLASTTEADAARPLWLAILYHRDE